MKKLILAPFACLALLPVPALTQSKGDIQYKKQSEKIRKTVWAWDKPEFKATAIPEKYGNASKVIIAHHTELVADSKTKLAYYGLGFGTNREQIITEIVREMVKVNDKSAVDGFSELSFTRFQGKSGFVSRAKSTTFVGVRIIKPDQSVREVDADEMVLTKDAATEKRAKLAIPDLEPGDIIDYFIATEEELTNDYDAKPYTVVLFDDAPVLHYSFHGQLGKKYAIDYRSYNGAPDLNVTKNSDKELIIDVEKKDMAPYESSLWVAPALQLPLIRMNISLGYRGMGAKYLGTSKPGEVTKNADTDAVVESQADIFAKQYYFTFFMKGSQDRADFEALVSDAKRRAKLAGLNYKTMPEDEWASYLFYTLRFTRLLAFNINRMERSIEAGDYTFNGLALSLKCLLKTAGVEAGIVVSSPRTGFRMNEVLDPDDLVNAAYLEESRKILYLKSIYDYPFDIPQSIDGVKDTRTIKFKNRGVAMSPAAINKFASANPGFALSASNAVSNSHLEQLAITLNPGETKVSVQRRAIIKGHYKYDWQRKLILYEDYYEQERKLMGDPKSLLQVLEENKKSRQYVDEVKNAFAEARKNQKKAFTDEARSWFEQEVSDMTDFKVEKMGVRHTDPDFVFSSAFSLDGLMKKAGNNLIFEIGKIQGEPLSVRADQRKRELDIYMAFPRSIGYDIRIKIPEGYSVEGIEALKKTVENETGYFKADASVNGQTITVTIKKSYFHAFEPAVNWDKMLAFIDAANEWTNAKLLFKKN